MRRLKKKAGYDFSYNNVNSILDAMTFKGDSDNEHVNFTGTIPVETLKSHFGLTDEDVRALPGAVKNGEVDFEALTEDLFKDYIGNRDEKYELKDQEVTVDITNNEFYIEGTAVIDFDGSEMNDPTEFNQNNFI